MGLTGQNDKKMLELEEQKASIKQSLDFSRSKLEQTTLALEQLQEEYDTLKGAHDAQYSSLIADSFYTPVEYLKSYLKRKTRVAIRSIWIAAASALAVVVVCVIASQIIAGFFMNQRYEQLEVISSQLTAQLDDIKQQQTLQAKSTEALVARIIESKPELNEPTPNPQPLLKDIPIFTPSPTIQSTESVHVVANDNLSEGKAVSSDSSVPISVSHQLSAFDLSAQRAASHLSTYGNVTSTGDMRRLYKQGLALSILPYSEFNDVLRNVGVKTEWMPAKQEHYVIWDNQLVYLYEQWLQALQETSDGDSKSIYQYFSPYAKNNDATNYNGWVLAANSITELKEGVVQRLAATKQRLCLNKQPEFCGS